MPEPKQSPMQLLGFDFGLRQIGVATGNGVTGVAAERGILMAKQGIPNWDEVQSYIDTWRPQLCLIGMPLNMDGTESELSALSRKFANRIHGRFAVPIEMVDERLSSREAKEIARKQGHKGDYKKKPIDDLAAKILVEQWLNSQS